MELVRSTETEFAFGPIIRTTTLELLAPQVDFFPPSPFADPTCRFRLASLH